MAQILIIDDDAVSRVLLRHLLTKAGHTVLEAEDGIAGLEMFHQNDIDLIISDQEMPRASGLELRRMLGPDLAVPFVLLTGYANKEEFVGRDELGQVDAFLTKPVASHSVSEVLEQIVAPAL